MFSLHCSSTLKNDTTELNMYQERQWDYFDTIVFPASGPKAFVTIGFDYNVLLNTTSPKWFIGGSTGALRMICIVSSHIDSINKLPLLEDLYIRKLGYTEERTTFDIHHTSDVFKEGIRSIIAPEKIDSVLQHPLFKIGIFLTEIRYPYNTYNEYWLFLYMLYASVVPSFRKRLFRPVVYTTHDDLCFEPPEDMVVRRLTKDNIYDVLFASCSFPTALHPLTSIDGHETLFYDSVFTQWYLNVCIREGYRGLLLCDTLNPQPSWMDFWKPWNCTPEHYFKNCSVVQVNQLFIDTLERPILPDGNEWFQKGIHDIRQQSWDQVCSLSKEWFRIYNKHLLNP